MEKKLKPKKNRLSRQNLTMASTSELIRLINEFDFSERLKIVEEVLRGIREEKARLASDTKKEPITSPKILELAGLLTEEEAAVYEKAIEESRKIDANEW